MRVTVQSSIAILVFSCLGHPLAAQTVRGQLMDALGRVPIDRAFMVLLGEDGTEVNRVLTDSEGRFRLDAPGAGTYRLRSERIGFRAGLSDPFGLEVGGSHEVEMEVTPVVIRLDTIVIRGDSKKCKVVQEQGLETATVWEEARKALAGVAWSESQQLLTFEIRSYRQYYERNMRPSHVRATTIRRTSVMPFRNPDASVLQERGYVLEDSSVYYAPDAEVFFSDVFLDHHCFKLDRDNDYEGLVGLVFEPTRGGDVPDVKGTLWLDEETSELRWLELEYTELRSHLRRRHSSARIEFAQLPTGMWFVRHWMIRMPNIEVRRPEIAGPTQRREILWGFEEEGREVLRVFSVDGELLYEAPADSVQGRG